MALACETDGSPAAYTKSIHRDCHEFIVLGGQISHRMGDELANLDLDVNVKCTEGERLQMRRGRVCCSPIESRRIV